MPGYAGYTESALRPYLVTLNQRLGSFYRGMRGYVKNEDNTGYAGYTESALRPYPHLQYY